MEHTDNNNLPFATATTRSRTAGSAAGFSLIEVALSLTVIAILTAIVAVVIGAGKKHAMMATETSAMRALISSYLMTPADNGGLLLQAEKTGGQYRERWTDMMTGYFNDSYKNTLYVNEQIVLYDYVQKAQGGDRYILSMWGSFGMNHRFIGGNYNSWGKLLDDDVVTNLSEAERPAQLIVFTSAIAKNRPSGLGLPADAVNAAGYYKVDSPSSGWRIRDVNPKESTVSPSYGGVAFRHGGEAVVAFLDGSVRMMGSSDMRDMRLWSNGARLANNSNYAPPIAE